MRPPRWLQRLLLGGFEPDEIEDILGDVEELARARPRRTRALYYWVELTKYPLRRVVEATREWRTSSEKGRGGMGAFGKDLRYATRSLVRNPGFTVMAFAIMTIAMGAASAMFSVVDGVLLRPLPIAEPHRVVTVWLEGGDGRRFRMTPGNFVDLEQLEGVFSSVAAFGSQSASLTLGDDAVFLRGSRVTPGYFSTLGVEPVVGRGFTVDEGDDGGPAVVVLSHHVWQQMFAADADIAGRAIHLDGQEFQVVGVVPPGVYPTRATVSAEIPFTESNQDFFVPLRYGPSAWANRRSHVLGMIGRVAPDVSPAVAEARIAGLSARLQANEPLNQDERFLMTSFTEEVVGDVRFALLTLLGTVGLILLIAIVNVGALFVLRADDRQPELAVRLAMGAPRGRLARQMFVESAMIVALASVGAIMVARGGLALMRVLVPYQIPRLADVTVSGTALVVTAAVALAVATVFGLAPAARLWGERLSGPVTRARLTAGSGQRRVQAVVVGVQAALCVVVLVGAGLLARSYGALRAVDPGFEARDAWTMSIPAPMNTLLEVVEDVRRVPGVGSAAIVYDHPLERNWGDGFLIDGVEPSDSDPSPAASLRPFGEGYFGAAGVAVVEGRVPDRADFAGEEAYAVVNEALARTFFPVGNAVGSTIILPTAQRMFDADGRFEIVGVVRDVHFLGPDEAATPALYVPLSHFPVNASRLHVRPEVQGTSVLAEIRAAVRSVDPTLVVQNPRRMSDILDDLMARPRFNMMLLLTFGVIGLILCGLGAYGLMGRSVAMRVREIGIQMALGADRGRLARAVVGGALKPLMIGGLVGIGVAFGMGRLIRSLLFGVSPADPISFVVSGGFLLMVGVLAAFVPAVRAVSIDPAVALRGE